MKWFYCMMNTGDPTTDELEFIHQRQNSNNTLCKDHKYISYQYEAGQRFNLDVVAATR